MKRTSHWRYAFRAQKCPQVFLEVKKNKEVKYIECRYDKREHIEKLVMEAEKVVNLKDIKILISCLCWLQRLSIVSIGSLYGKSRSLPNIVNVIKTLYDDFQCRVVCMSQLRDSFRAVSCLLSFSFWPYTGWRKQSQSISKVFYGCSLQCLKWAEMIPPCKQIHWHPRENHHSVRRRHTDQHNKLGKIWIDSLFFYGYSLRCYQYFISLLQKLSSTC